MKNRIIILLICLILIIPVIFLSYSFMKRSLAPDTLYLDKAVVTCEIEKIITGSNIVSLKVRNTGNTESYIRLILSAHWEDEEGKTIGRPASFPNISITSDWIKDPNSQTYYCKVPKAPNAVTPELLASIVTLTETVIDDTTTAYLVIDAAAESIQSLPDLSVEESWNVITENHTIISTKE